MLGVGNDLVTPNLAGKELDGEKISKLFAQKIVWLVPETDLLCSTAVSIEPYMCDTESQNTSPQQPTVSAEHTTASLQQPAIHGGDPTTKPSTSSASGHHPMSSTQYPTTSTQYPTTSSPPPVTTTSVLVPSTPPPVDSTPPPVASTQYPTTSGHYPTTSHQHLSKDEETQLREMFPDRELESIIANSCDLNEAVNSLLGNHDEIGNVHYC